MIGFVGTVGFARSHGKRCISPRVKMASANALDSAVAEQFGSLVRGEWIGHEFSFDGETGTLQELEDGYIPEEFLMWGVKPRGFESTQSSILRGEKLYRKHQRIIPTVDHFSDHTDVEEENHIHTITENGFDFFDCGSYVLAPVKVFERKKSLDKVPKIEVCLRDSVIDSDHRIMAVMRFDFGTGRFFKSQQVFHEKYDMDYADGQFVESGSGYRAGWGEKESITPEMVEGTWKTVNSGEEVERKLDFDSSIEQVLLLPAGVHMFSRKQEDGSMELEMGWLVQDSTRIAMKTNYSAEGDFISSTKIVELRS